MEQIKLTLPEELNAHSVNRALAGIGIDDRVNGACVRMIFGSITRERFWTAITLAQQDPRAKQWIVSVIARAKSRTGTAMALVPQPQNTSEGDDEPESGSLHVYGRSAAVTVEADLTRSRVPTVAIDAAKATAPRTYDWDAKIRIQLTMAELPVVTAVFLGLIGECEYHNHGREHDKGFAMQHQGNKIYLRVFAKGFLAALPAEPPDCFRVAALLMRQLKKRHPSLNDAAILEMLRAMAAMAVAPAA
jgi:hypothetical protein